MKERIPQDNFQRNEIEKEIFLESFFNKTQEDWTNEECEKVRGLISSDPRIESYVIKNIVLKNIAITGGAFFMLGIAQECLRLGIDKAAVTRFFSDSISDNWERGESILKKGSV